MSPAERAASFYERVRMPRSFREDLDAHLQTGYVISTPELFMLARGVDIHASHYLIEDPWNEFAREAQNCWLIYLVAGSVKTCFNYAPYPLPFVAWARDNTTLSVFPFEKIKRLCRLLK